MARIQTPQVLWIGCSDSRTPPEDITGTLPGDVFVQRNVSNLVTPGDMNLMSVLQVKNFLLTFIHEIFFFLSMA